MTFSISRLIQALVVAVLVGIVLVWLLGPVLISLAVPPAVIVGEFLVRAGWILGICAGLWFYFSGATFLRPRT